MELTIAIWEDCKRLLTDNQPITYDRLQPFANINVHAKCVLCIDRATSVPTLSGDRIVAGPQIMFQPN